MKILLVTDAFYPQINGVVTTLSNVVKELEAQGHEFLIVQPNLFKSFPCPTYPEIRLSLDTWRVGPMIDEFAPDAVHIATEGPLGIAARIYCAKKNIDFTTSYHTKFPEYVKERFWIPVSWTFKYFKWFHKNATKTLVTNLEMKKELEERGFKNLVVWSRGVDRDLFNPNNAVQKGIKRPIFLYVGRISVEKNISSFLDLDLEGTKVVVGDGPQLEKLKEQYRDVVFLGAKKGYDLAQAYASSDVFVFPSKSDTFGIVMLEAMASGLPIAAYPVTGPLGVVENGYNGYCDDNLETAILNCLNISKDDCRKSSEKYSWSHCAQIFFDNLIKFD